MTPTAIQKRNYRVVQKEKRRRSTFIHHYMRIKHPKLFNEANAIYLELSAKYPGKADLTKTYYFRKWESGILKTQNSRLMVPHLPVLMSSEKLQQTTTNQQVQATEVQHHEVHEEHTTEVQHHEVHEEQATEVHHHEVHEEQATEVQHHEVPEEQLTEVQSTVEVQTTEPLDLTCGLSLNEMSLSVEELVKALQTDQDMMDLVEGFDLPEGVWNNELAVPDYVLESDLEW